MRRLVVIGLDGASLEFLRYLCRRAELRALRLFVERGWRGEMLSTVPPATVPAWRVLTSGAPPDVLRLLYWVEFDQERKTLRIARPSSAVPDVWDILGSHGYRSVVVNVPATLPRRINGVFVAGPPLVSERDFARPKRFERLLRLLLGYRVYMRRTLQVSPLASREATAWRLRALSEALRLAKLRLVATELLVRKVMPDFVFTVIFYTDHVQHYLNNDKEERLLIAFWRALDAYLYEFMSRVRKVLGRVTFMLVSDHGHARINLRFHVNNWLVEHGFLEVSTEVIVRGALSGVASAVLYRTPLGTALAHVLGEDFLTRRLRRSRWEPLRATTPLERLKLLLRRDMRRLTVSEILPHVVWSRTLAFAPNWFSLYVNARWGSEEFEDVRAELMSRLRSLSAPDGRSVFDLVSRAEELYSEEFCRERGLAILAIPRSGVFMDPALRFPWSIWSENSEAWSSAHTRDAVFALYHEEMPRRELGEVTILDVAPTILSYYSVDKPSYMPGESLLERLP